MRSAPVVSIDEDDLQIRKFPGIANPCFTRPSQNLQSLHTDVVAHKSKVPRLALRVINESSFHRPQALTSSHFVAERARQDGSTPWIINLLWSKRRVHPCGGETCDHCVHLSPEKLATRAREGRGDSLRILNALKNARRRRSDTSSCFCLNATTSTMAISNPRSSTSDLSLCNPKGDNCKLQGWRSTWEEFVRKSEVVPVACPWREAARVVLAWLTVTRANAIPQRAGKYAPRKNSVKQIYHKCCLKQVRGSWLRRFQSHNWHCLYWWLRNFQHRESTQSITRNSWRIQKGISAINSNVHVWANAHILRITLILLSSSLATDKLCEVLLLFI